MDNSVDDDGEALFTDEFEHGCAVYSDYDGDRDVDVIKTNGNIWFHASDVVALMGMNTNDTGNTGRTLQRLDHPDVVKIKDTPLRFPDGRRNRGSLVSPRAVVFFADAKTKNYNPFRALKFRDWMQDELLKGLDADHWSPAKREITVLAPVFRKVTHQKTDDNPELDPRRPRGRYLPLVNMPPIQSDEVEFCLCGDERNGLGKCWCRGKGGIRNYVQQQIELVGELDCVIDEDDVFEVTTEIVTLSRIKTVPVPAGSVST